MAYVVDTSLSMSVDPHVLLFFDSAGLFVAAIISELQIAESIAGRTDAHLLVTTWAGGALLRIALDQPFAQLVNQTALAERWSAVAPSCCGRSSSISSAHVRHGENGDGEILRGGVTIQVGACGIADE